MFSSIDDNNRVGIGGNHALDLLVLFLNPVPFECITKTPGNQPRRAFVFAHKFLRAFTQRIVAHSFVARARKHDDGHFLMDFVQPFQRIQSLAVGQIEIEDDCIDW